MENIGWTPVLGAEKVEGGFIIKVEDWLGAGCNKPATKLYLNKEGYSKNKDNALVIPVEDAKEPYAPIRSNDFFKPLTETENE